jgi:hypothetical protein
LIPNKRAHIDVRCCRKYETDGSTVLLVTEGVPED